MPATEELRVYIRTIADTSGVKETQRVVQESRRSLGAGGAAAIGGIAGIAANQIQNQIQNVVQAFGDSVQAAREHERVIRATGMAYGQAAGQFQEFAQQLSATTGFTSDAILEAALSARTLSQNYGLTIQQTQKLISVSADLARVRGIGVAEAFERVQSAIRGEAEASEYLGLTLNDTYLTNQAMNGSLKNTYGTMTDVQKAQVRYNELLRQSAQFSGLAASSADSLDGAFNRVGTSAHNASLRIGELTKPATLEGLLLLAVALDEIAKTGTNAADVKVGTTLQNIGQGLDKLRTATSGKSLVDLQQDSVAVTEALDDIRQAGERADLTVRGSVTRISNNLADLKDRYVEVVDAAQQMARVAFMDQVSAAVRDATAAQQEQVDLQHRSVDLAAEEAQIRLSMLPAQQQMAELQRQMTEQQIRARRAALPATEALEDLRFAQQRAELISRNRNVSVEERVAARRELRGIARAMPGAELGALEAGRPVTLAERAATRVGMEAQLFQINNERQLAQIEAAQTTNTLLSQIAAQRTQAIELTINLGTEEFQKEIFKQLVEAEQQAQGPTVIKLSGVRRQS